VSQVAEAEIGETKTLALLEAGLASPQTTTMNYGSLSHGEGAWVVIVNRGATGNLAELAETAFSTQYARIANSEPCNRSFKR
jgi:hypothetical protein